MIGVNCTYFFLRGKIYTFHVAFKGKYKKSLNRISALNASFCHFGISECFHLHLIYHADILKRINYPSAETLLMQTVCHDVFELLEI